MIIIVSSSSTAVRRHSSSLHVGGGGAAAAAAAAEVDGEPQHSEHLGRIISNRNRCRFTGDTRLQQTFLGA